MRRLILPDTHFPNVDRVAFNVMLQCAKHYKPNEVVILGDWQDVYCLSRFEKNPEIVAKDLSEELAPGIKAYHDLLDLLKPQKVYFIVGNHTHRITKYIHTNAPLIHRYIPPLRELYELSNNTEIIPYGKFLVLDGVTYCHGIAVGKNCTARMLDMLGCNVVFGHTHRVQLSTKRMVDGRVFTAYSMGWLGDYSAIDYTMVPDWGHAFGTATTIKGRTDVQIHQIQNRGIIFQGKEFVFKRKSTSR